MPIKNLIRKIIIIAICIFAGVGLFFVGGFLAVKFHLTNTSGRVDFSDRYFAEAAKRATRAIAGSDKAREFECRAWVMSGFYPETARKILAEYASTGSTQNLTRMVVAAEIYLRTKSGYSDEADKCQQFASQIIAEHTKKSTASSLYTWIDTPEWDALSVAIRKDADLINQVAKEIGVEPRLIVAQLVGEQMRLFNTEREVFKQFFQPLKIMGNEVQFSWGVAGFKEDTAKMVEKNLRDNTSPFYLGSAYENLLDFSTANPDEERFNRLTNDKNHYYSYLYTALFLKQIGHQWEKAGYPIMDRPEILSTIFNLGFEKSLPKAEPQVGGAEIEIKGEKYTFGSLAHQFYYSGELSEDFPLK